MTRTTLFLLLAAAACRGPETREVSESRDPRFEWFRALPGAWIATEDSSAPGMEVDYRSTSGGSVLEETIAPGTSHEMVTMIHPAGEGIVLTHYCALGNQPRMRATPAAGDERRVEFRCQGGTNMGEGDMHMHEAAFTFVADDHVQTSWSLFEEGRLVEVKRFDLVRRDD